MAVEPRESLKSYFETGDKPTQEQFWAVIDSFYHKSEDSVDAPAVWGNITGNLPDQVDLLTALNARVSSIGSLGGRPSNAFGGTIENGAIFFQPADGSNPGMVTAAAQTLGGRKTFASGITVASGQTLVLAGQTAGHIPFLDSGLALATSASLFWDATNSRLSVGAGVTPGGLLSIGASTSARPSLFVDTGVAPSSPVVGQIYRVGSDWTVQGNWISSGSIIATNEYRFASSASNTRLYAAAASDVRLGVNGGDGLRIEGPSAANLLVTLSATQTVTATSTRGLLLEGFVNLNANNINATPVRLQGTLNIGAPATGGFGQTFNCVQIQGVWSQAQTSYTNSGSLNYIAFIASNANGLPKAGATRFVSFSGGGGASSAGTISGLHLSFSGITNDVTNYADIRVIRNSTPETEWGYISEVAQVPSFGQYLGGKSGFGLPTVPTSTSTLTAWVHIGPATTGTASLRIVRATGVTAPSAPLEGDVWLNDNGLNIYFNGSVRTFNLTP